MYKEPIHTEEISIQGDPNDRIQKAIDLHIAMCGRGQFKMSEVAEFAKMETADDVQTEEEKDIICEKYRISRVNDLIGQRKAAGKTVLRNLRNGVPVSDVNKRRAVLQVSKEYFILCQNAKHQDIEDARTYWETGVKQTEVRDRENRADFNHVFQLEFDYLGDLM